MTTDVQQQARALGDPTRHRLFRYLTAAPGPVSVGELTEHVQLNHNAVRQHLAVLREAGLVTEETERRASPGRPRLLYRLHPETASQWGAPGAYAWLASLLSTAIRRRQEPRQTGRQEGHRRAAALAAGGDPADLMQEEMTRHGFRPARTEDGGRITFVLGRCSFAEVASADPGTICQLHLGLAEGFAEGIGRLAVEGLAATDPWAAGCRLAVRREAGRDDAASRPA